MKRLGMLAAIGFLSVLGVVPASAGVAPTESVSITGTYSGFGFNPATLTIDRGTTVEWTNDTTVQHIVAQDSPLSFWLSDALDPNGRFSVTLDGAGTFTYHCNIHSYMHGTIKVPIDVSPHAGSPHTTFRITIADVAAPAGFDYDVQRRKGNGNWTIFKTAVTAMVVNFHPHAGGTYWFRSRLHDTGSDATSGWSPAKSIKVK